MKFKYNPFTNNLDIADSGEGPSGTGTITGNDGVPISQVADNWNIVTDNATVEFTGAGSTLTQDFGLSNLLLGSEGASITSATFNVGLGLSALNALTSGIDNVAIGHQAGLLLTSGSNNIAIGKDALSALTTANNNTAIGDAALLLCSTGGSNIAIGNNALDSVTTGSSNISIGTSSTANLTTGQSNIVIGVSTGVSYTSSESNNVLIRSLGVAGDSGVIRIGTGSIQTTCFVTGINGVTVAASAPVAVNSSNQLSSLGFGTSGQVLTSTGAASSPTWQAATAPDSVTWSEVTGTTQAMAINNGYLANNVGLVTFTLPATAAQFSLLKVTGIGAGGWRISQNANQKITWLGVNSTVGVAGFISSIDTNACVTLRAYVGGASTFWVVESSEGNLTIS